jgi:hypothetical protein
VTDESDEQHAKHLASRTSTDAGIQIGCNEKQEENASMSIGFNVESDSNVTDESETHHAKQFAPRISTEAGIQIDSNEEQEENASMSI